jgi:hypothetical protein
MIEDIETSIKIIVVGNGEVRLTNNNSRSVKQA